MSHPQNRFARAHTDQHTSSDAATHDPAPSPSVRRHRDRQPYTPAPLPVSDTAVSQADGDA
jgi:hypothetical protein